jgi:hypothetical protein
MSERPSAIGQVRDPQIVNPRQQLAISPRTLADRLDPPPVPHTQFLAELAAGFDQILAEQAAAYDQILAELGASFDAAQTTLAAWAAADQRRWWHRRRAALPAPTREAGQP